MHPVPLPSFRQPLGQDEPLPSVPAKPSTSAPPAGPADSLQAQLQETGSDTDSQPGPPPPIPDPPAAARTRISASDPKNAQRFVRGLLAIVAGAAAAILARNGRHLRQPTIDQLGDIADPLGAILARHLPTEYINDTLIDATSAAAASHAYVLDGPLVMHLPSADIDYPEDTP